MTKERLEKERQEIMKHIEQVMIAQHALQGALTLIEKLIKEESKNGN